MAPRRQRAAFVDDGAGGLCTVMRAYIEWAQVSKLSEQTTKMREWNLASFADWCREREIVLANDVSRHVCERYQRHLFHFRKADGKPLSVGFQRERLSSLRVFFRWAAKHDHVLHNPAGEIELRRRPHRIPRVVLSGDEVEQILVQPDLSSPSGLRDRAMLETLYSTGLRRFELAKLEPSDVDLERGTLLVREGKGSKDRLVPIGERAIAFVLKYLDEGRPFLAVDDNVATLFLRDNGQAFQPIQLTAQVRRIVERAGVGKTGSCHLFRHTMATLMLEGGADIRFIQAMLGHAQLSTTEIYTHVSIRKLQDVHRATHPSATFDRRSKAAADIIDEDALWSRLDNEVDSDVDDDVDFEDDADTTTP